MGELAAKAIMEAMYPDKQVSELSEAEKQTIGMLASLSAGMAGALAGDSTSSAAAGAQAGKNAVENNSLAHVLVAAEANKAGTAEKWQEEQQAAIREACSGGTPVSCQMVVAMGTVMSGGLLPEAMVISGAISAGAVGGIDYAMNGSVDPNNVIAAYWVGVLTRSTGLEATMSINAAGGATTSYLDGKNPWVGGLVSGLTGGVAYGVGNKVVGPAMDEVFNPVWKSLGWDDIGMGISKPVQPSLWPSVAGATSGSSGGEYISNKVNDKIDEVKSNNGGNNK
jgi:filamentous hemagglutinin